MDIVPLREEVFDSFIRKTPQFCRDEITKALERLDRSICCGLDHGRFELIRLDRRTLLTSMGKVTFRRRYYYDNMQGAYCHPLDARIGIPPRQRLSQELQERVLDLASIMTYRDKGKMKTTNLGNGFMMKPERRAELRKEGMGRPASIPFRTLSRALEQPGQRFVKPFVVAKKAFQTSGSEAGARHTARLFSIIRTAIINGLDPTAPQVRLGERRQEADRGHPAVLEGPRNPLISTKT